MLPKLVQTYIRDSVYPPITRSVRAWSQTVYLRNARLTRMSFIGCSRGDNSADVTPLFELKSLLLEMHTWTNLGPARSHGNTPKLSSPHACFGTRGNTQDGGSERRTGMTFRGC